jgi:hypothetical protein
VSEGQIQVGEPQPVSPHEQALYEAGKEILIGSLAVGRDFCKFMVGVSTGAIPLYLGLLALALPKDYRPNWWKGIFAITPGAMFLVGAIVFAIGVFPRTSTFSLDIPEEIEQARSSAIRWRGTFASLGFIVFALAVVASIVVTIAALRVKTSEPPPKPTLVKIIK